VDAKIMSRGRRKIIGLGTLPALMLLEGLVMVTAAIILIESADDLAPLSILEWALENIPEGLSLMSEIAFR